MDTTATTDDDAECLSKNCSYLDCSEVNQTGVKCPESFFDHDEDFSLGASIINYACYIITFIAGSCGNSLVIYVVTRFSKMQTVTNRYIVNLAIADEIFLCGIPFLIATTALKQWIFGDTMCKLYMITTSFNQFASSLFLMIMSADRYIAVCHPINSPKIRTPFISKCVSTMAWILSAFMIVPIFMYSNAVQRSPGKYSCNVYFPDQAYIAGHSLFTLYSFVFSFGIPFSLIFIFYTLVVAKLRNVGGKMKKKHRRKSHRKVTKMVLTVVLVYLFCWLPYWILQLTLIRDPPKQGHSLFKIFIFLFSSCLTYLNSAVNPILYVFLSENFKMSFKRACSCLTAQTNVNANVNTATLTHRNKITNYQKSVFEPCEENQPVSHASPQSKASTGQTNPCTPIHGETEIIANNGQFLTIPNLRTTRV